MRVFFNLRDKTDSIPDANGIDVVDLAEARREAERAVAEFIGQEPVLEGGLKEGLKGWRLEAVDASGRVLFAISLDREPQG